MIGRLHQIDERERTRIEQCIASELAADPGVLFGYLYGSFAESQPFHDIDVGVHLATIHADKATPAALVLAQRMSERTRKPVDVRILNLAPVSFVYHVLRGQLVFCRDAAVLGEVMERTISRYLDIAPLLRWGTREAFAG
jgi:predicted nucleotidyltransferase